MFGVENVSPVTNMASCCVSTLNFSGVGRISAAFSKLGVGCSYGWVGGGSGGGGENPRIMARKVVFFNINVF